MRVSADGFSEARDKLAVVYTSYGADMWTAGFAAFVAPASQIATGVALTAVGGEHDRRFVFANWDEDGEAQVDVVARDFTCRELP